jgi:hypothetical protein
MGFPATAKESPSPPVSLKAGKIKEEWSVFDMGAAMQQAGYAFQDSDPPHIGRIRCATMRDHLAEAIQSHPSFDLTFRI